MSQETLFDSPTFDRLGDVERYWASQGDRILIGTDEAGRGPLAGPVFASAVALDLTAASDYLASETPSESGHWLSILDDSKQLTHEARSGALSAIENEAAAHSIRSCSASVIDDINILQASRKAMKRAVESVIETLESDVDRVIVDGNLPIEVQYPQSAVVGGDGLSLAVAAASILAKVSRDEKMIEADKQWPEYNFKSNKGYPTKQHRDAIREHGPCRIHRRSFSWGD